jgi:hypothetical protein
VVLGAFLLFLAVAIAFVRYLDLDRRNMTVMKRPQQLRPESVEAMFRALRGSSAAVYALSSATWLGDTKWAGVHARLRGG